ncbi:MAG: hypothetical protein HY559_05675 [Gammaproteobacteria bacterium]|nr:hypothetical protein [Gammaproteobacteria bacterium]
MHCIHPFGKDIIATVCEMSISRSYQKHWVYILSLYRAVGVYYGRVNVADLHPGKILKRKVLWK